MNRRELLQAAGASAGALLAGCLDDGTGGGNGLGNTPTNSPTDSPTPTSSPTASPSATEPDNPSSVSGTSFDIVSVDCGEGENQATVSFSEHVSIKGVVRGSNTCYTAELKSTDYDARADRLAVQVRSYVPDSDQSGGCAQCIVDIEYNAEVRFDGDLPETVVVKHNGKEVAWEQH